MVVHNGRDARPFSVGSLLWPIMDASAPHTHSLSRDASAGPTVWFWRVAHPGDDHHITMGPTLCDSMGGEGCREGWQDRCEPAPWKSARPCRCAIRAGRHAKGKVGAHCPSSPRPWLTLEISPTAALLPRTVPAVPASFLGVQYLGVTSTGIGPSIPTCLSKKLACKWRMSKRAVSDIHAVHRSPCPPCVTKSEHTQIDEVCVCHHRISDECESPEQGTAGPQAFGNLVAL